MLLTKSRLIFFQKSLTLFRREPKRQGTGAGYKAEHVAVQRRVGCRLTLPFHRGFGGHEVIVELELVWQDSGSWFAHSGFRSSSVFRETPDIDGVTGMGEGTLEAGVGYDLPLSDERAFCDALEVLASRTPDQINRTREAVLAYADRIHSASDGASRTRSMLLSAINEGRQAFVGDRG